MIALLVLVFVSPLQPAVAAGPQDGVVKIISGGKKGSGFVVGYDSRWTFIVTAAHVIEGDPRPEVQFAVAPHDRYATQVVQIDLTLDVAALKLDGSVTGMVPLPLDERRVKPPESLQAIGFPRRELQPRWSSGAASANKGSQLVFDKGLAEGHSGGPLMRGDRVVGLVKTTEVDYAYAVPAPFLRQVLESWGVPLIRPTPREATTLPADRGGSPGGQGAPPIPAPRSGPCTATVTSRSGASQPIRQAASPHAMAPSSLPDGTVVAVLSSKAGSGHTWYRVQYQGLEGWIQDDHVRLAGSCPR